MTVHRLSVPILSPGQGSQDYGKTESQIFFAHANIFRSLWTFLDYKIYKLLILSYIHIYFNISKYLILSYLTCESGPIWVSHLSTLKKFEFLRYIASLYADLSTCNSFVQKFSLRLLCLECCLQNELGLPALFCWLVIVYAFF